MVSGSRITFCWIVGFFSKMEELIIHFENGFALIVLTVEGLNFRLFSVNFRMLDAIYVWLPWSKRRVVTYIRRKILPIQREKASETLCVQRKQGCCLFRVGWWTPHFSYNFVSFHEKRINLLLMISVYVLLTIYLPSIFDHVELFLVVESL